MNIMQSDDFLRQVVMDGRADALTFVGTASDDLDPESAREELNLDPDAPESDVIVARNEEARRLVRSQLKDLAARMASLAGEDGDRARQLAKVFLASKIFTVSAREYLRLAGLARTRNAGFDTAEQTELPALRAHMQRICARFGRDARADAHVRQISILLAEIDRELRSQRVPLAQQTETTERQRKELGTAAEASRSFLTSRLSDLGERFRQDLEADQALLSERIKRAVERGQRELQNTLSRWSALHWATIRAVVRREGVYRGSTGNHNFPADLSKPVLDAITFAWVDFFGDRLSQGLEKWSERLLQCAEEHRLKLLEALSSLLPEKSRLHAHLKSIIETTERVIAEQLSQTRLQMNEKIDRNRRDLYERIPEHVAGNMRAAFDQAADESGTGMKLRMVAIISDHATRVCAVMFADAEQAILEGVRGLTDWLARKYVEMTTTVGQHADIAIENLNLEGGQISPEEIDQRRAVLDAIGAAVAEVTA
jgi:hypothetical protein